MGSDDGLRVVFPLWGKLGLLFGALVGAFIAIYGQVAFEDDLRDEKSDLRTRLVGLATTLAEAIDGDVHRTWRRAEEMKTPEYRRTSVLLLNATGNNGVSWIGTTTRDARGRYAFVVDAAPSPLPIGYPIFDGKDERDRAWAGEVVFAEGLEDEYGVWHAAIAPIRSGGGEVVGLVEVMADADALDLYAESRQSRLLTQIALAIAISIATAAGFARWLNRHLGQLTEAALAVAGGDLDRRVLIPTRDEIGVLGRAFDLMVKGLREREFIRDTFGRFVDRRVVEQVLADPKRLALGGEQRRVTVLMSDLRGFTRLSSDLGPDRMVALLNRYFTRMSEVVATWDGTIGELVGDGLVCFFGAPQSREDDATRAIACAIAMHEALARFCVEEGRALEMGIGIDTGDVVAGNIGSEKQMKYGVVGEAINLAARLESFTIGNQILVSAATLIAAGPTVEAGEGFEMRAKGRSEPIRCHVVIAVGELRMPEPPETDGIDVGLPARVWRMDGKRVEDAVHLATVVHVRRRTVRLRTDLRPGAREKLRLSLDVGGQRLDELYGTVMDAGDGEVTVVITSAPDAAREALAALLGE